MSKKIMLMGVLAAFLFQTQAMAAMSNDAEREILSDASQKSIPNKDKKAPSYKVIWSRQEDDKVKMNQADREREILGNSQRSVSVPVDTDEDVRKAEERKKAKKEKAKQAEQKKDSANSAPGEDAEQQAMHSSSMAWDNPNVSKNIPAVETEDDGDRKDADKKAKKKKAKKERAVSLADRERDILGSKGNRTW